MTASENRAQPGWPTGWASIAGGLFLALPYVLGVLDGLGVPGVKDPSIRQPAFFSLAIGVGMLLLSLYGWWRVGHLPLGRLGVVVLAIAFGLWFLDLADNLWRGVLPFYVPEETFAALVGIGSLLVALGLWRTTRLPRDGLVTLGICGPAGMAMLAAPWPLGLGPVVPAVVILYAVGWIRLGAAVRTTNLDTTANTRSGVGSWA
jgi:hypothetical protein